MRSAVVAYNGFGTLVGQIGWFRWALFKDAVVIADASTRSIGPVATLRASDGAARADHARPDDMATVRSHDVNSGGREETVLHGS